MRTGHDVLEHEIRQEQAATIGRLARELRDALDALATFDRQARGGESAPDRRDPRRASLVDAAAYALWNFIVQRECSGFRGTRQVLGEYAVPAEVQASMGVVRPRWNTSTVGKRAERFGQGPAESTAVQLRDKRRTG